MELITIREAIENYNKDKRYAYAPHGGLYIIRRNCCRKGHHGLVSFDGVGQKGYDVYNGEEDGALEVLKLILESHEDGLKIYELDSEEEIEVLKNKLDLVKMLEK